MSDGSIPLKLHWSSRSPFARKVMVAAHEMGLADRIELVPTVVAMTQPNRDLMRSNPLGKIPTLFTDDGTVLFDSTVICEYLDSLNAGRKLFPADARQRWQALRWHALGDNLLDTLVLWRNELIRPADQRSPETIATYELKARNAVDFLEKESAALAAAPFGIGHVALGVALGYLDFRFSALGWRSGHPNLAAWHAAFAQRGSARATEPVDA
jgi:glutathione S-transferase